MSVYARLNLFRHGVERDLDSPPRRLPATLSDPRVSAWVERPPEAIPGAAGQHGGGNHLGLGSASGSLWPAMSSCHFSLALRLFTHLNSPAPSVVFCSLPLSPYSSHSTALPLLNRPLFPPLNLLGASLWQPPHSFQRRSSTLFRLGQRSSSLLYPESLSFTPV